MVAVSRCSYLQGGEDEVAQTDGLGQLTSPARTVQDLATLLMATGASLNPALKTLRVLASSSMLEWDGEPEEKDGSAFLSLPDVQGATAANMQAAIQEWRRDASPARGDRDQSTRA